MKHGLEKAVQEESKGPDRAFTYSLGQGDRQEPVRDGGTLRLISLNICLITLSTSSNYTNTTEPGPSKIAQKLHKQTSVKLRF